MNTKNEIMKKKKQHRILLLPNDSTPEHFAEVILIYR